MIEPPDLPVETIVARIRDRYRLAVEDATFLPVGNDSSAWSFRLDGSDQRWFLKVFGRRVEQAAVEVPRFLATMGVGHLVPAIPTADGEPFDTGSPFSFVVFPFVDAAPGGEIGLREANSVELGRFLRHVHETTPDDHLGAMLRHERFDLRDQAYIEQVGSELGEADPPDAIGVALLERWEQQRDDIAHTLRRAQELATYGRSAPRELVICHADFHAWNVLIEPSGAFHVVDWDEVVFAPRERDLMFVSGDVADIDPTGEHFYAGYGKVSIDPALLAYYRYDWVLQELADYHRRVFDASLGEQTRAEALDSFVELFGPEDVVAAAYRADAAIPLG
jgi:spectinomycin phosphotransferase